MAQLGQRGAGGAAPTDKRACGLACTSPGLGGHTGDGTYLESDLHLGQQWVEVMLGLLGMVDDGDEEWWGGRCWLSEKPASQKLSVEW